MARYLRLDMVCVGFSCHNGRIGLGPLLKKIVADGPDVLGWWAESGDVRQRGGHIRHPHQTPFLPITFVAAFDTWTS